MLLVCASLKALLVCIKVPGCASSIRHRHVATGTGRAVIEPMPIGFQLLVLLFVP
jgi:hypothetical protein